MSTKIAWCDETWNPIVGCSPASWGCRNCYAAKMAYRLEAMGIEKYNGLTKKSGGRIEWTGKINVDKEGFEKPLRWKKPRRIFVCSMGDLFHEDVPWWMIVKVFEAISNAPQHTYMVLTKRPEKMLEWVKDWCESTGKEPLPGQFVKEYPNVQLGFTAESQKEANERIPVLLRTPAAVRFVSCEPLLGPMDFSAYFGGCYVGLPGDKLHDDYNFGIDGVIVGCESGPKRRECKLEWVRDIRDQCQAANVPLFVKQLSINGKVSHNPDDWPEDLRIRELPESEIVKEQEDES